LPCSSVYTVLPFDSHENLLLSSDIFPCCRSLLCFMTMYLVVPFFSSILSCASTCRTHRYMPYPLVPSSSTHRYTPVVSTHPYTPVVLLHWCYTPPCQLCTSQYPPVLALPARRLQYGLLVRTRRIHPPTTVRTDRGAFKGGFHNNGTQKQEQQHNKTTKHTHTMVKVPTHTARDHYVILVFQFCMSSPPYSSCSI
jgi:hypothetical protein